MITPWKVSEANQFLICFMEKLIIACPVLLMMIISSLMSTCNGQAKKDSIPVRGYVMIWHDEFTGQKLDLAKWNYRGLGKRDQAFISSEAVSLDGSGHLVIEVSKRSDSIFTGMIGTENLFSSCYGYFECRAKLSTTPGTFPAFWLQSPRISVEEGGIDANGAEIDIFEYFPHTKRDSVAHTLHYGGYAAGHRVAGPAWGALQPSTDGFHTFGFEWTPTTYKTFVDGLQTFTGNQLISHIPEFIVLSLGVSESAAGPLKLSELPDQFVVDYVRVFKRTGSAKP